MIERKRWRQLVPAGIRHHLAILRITPGRSSRFHTHDFPELFWLESGTGHHQINGESHSLYTGDLIFIRPSDQHVLTATDPAGFTLVNLAYHPDVSADLIQRHPRETQPLLAPTTPLPHRVKLPPSSLPTWRRRVDHLGEAPASRLGIEAFLLTLLDSLADARLTKRPPMPDWLQRACDEAQRPAVFAQGVSGFVRQAGRSPEHVARRLHQTLGLTPSQFINRIRMDYAARELRVTERPIADIALDCGLHNLSHFYQLFRRYHGVTPRAHRLAHHRGIT